MAPTSRSVVRPDEDLARGAYYWHEVIGCAVRGIDGEELGTVKDIYRVGETEVFTVAGGAVGDFDLPAVRAFIRIFAPRRGEIVVDAASLDLRPARSRTPIRIARRRPTPEPSGAAASASDRPRPATLRPSSRPRGRRARSRGRGARAMTLEIDVLTLFPAMFEGPLAASIPGRIQEQGLATVRIHDLRDWGLGRIARSTTRPTVGERG